MKKLWGFVNLVGLLIAAAGFITHSAVLIVLGIAVCLLGEWQKSRVSKAQRAQAQTGAIRPALADVFDSADYQPDERLSGLDIDPMQLLLHQDYHYVDGCDKITATYHGVSVLLGNVRLMDTDVFRDEESGMERKTEKEVWQGLMLTCKVGHSFPIGFAIAPRGKIDGLLRYADVKTGNETFDKRFTVKTDNGDAALLTLTPRMQEKILAAASVSPGPLFVTFCQDGRVSAAVRTNGRNFFVPEKAGAEGARARLTENLREILAIVDEANPVAAAPAQEGGA